MITPFSFWRACLLLASLFAFSLSGTVFAQDNPPVAPGQDGNAQFGNFPNAPVNSILDNYEQLSGKHLIRDVALAQVPPMTINATGVSKPEMLKLIEQALLLNGVAIIQIDDHTAKVVSTPLQGKNPRSEGVKIFANAADLPANDQVVSYYMPLNYINPQEAVNIFQGTSPPHNYGQYVPAPSAQAIVLTENASVIRQLIALKELIDVPPARVVSEFVQLNRSDAEKTAELLNKLLDQQSGPGAAPAAAGPGGAVMVPADLGNLQPMQNEHNLLSGPAKIIPDTRSNSLLIVTRPVNMPFLKQLIAQLDSVDIYMMPQRRPLKYVLAQDILPALEASLAQGKEEQDQVKKDATPNNASNSNQAQNQATTSGGLNNSSSNSGGGQSLSSVTSPLQAPPQNNAPTVVTIGKTRLLADNRSNSIIVFGSPDMVNRVFSMVDQLDRKPLQVYLATVIGQLTVSEGEEFGIDILQKFQKIGQGGIASSLITPGSATANAANSTTGTTTTGLPDPTHLTSSLGFLLPQGLTLYGAIGSTLDAYVRALETTNRFKVISRPSVYTTNNKLAVIASGSQIPVPGTTVSGFTGSSSTLTSSSSTQYESVLLELEIIPLINANHEVTLQIRQTNNSQGASQIISGNSVPSILTQEINTEVTVPDKATIVIGGLISDNTSRKTSGVPWLSDIPVLGYLFKDTVKNKERDELIIMIQPTVVETDADQIATNEVEKQRTILGREALQAATGFSEKAPNGGAQLPQPNTGVGYVPAIVSDSPVAPATTVQTTTYNSKTGKKTTTTTTTAPRALPVYPATVVTPAGPVSKPPGVVPESSTASPDVSSGKMPKNPPMTPAENSTP